jgi:hypothetical protein
MARHSSEESPSRRDFLRMTGVGLGAAALGLGASEPAAAASQAGPLSPSAAGASGAAGPYSILFILVDQDIFRLNDVELFDLEADPWETVNLAGDRKKNGDLLQHMNDKLNRLIADEVGEDAGQMLPGGVDAGWVATPAVDDV